MQELLADAGAELLPLAARAVAAVALTLLGGVAEMSALSSLLDGAILFGLWKVYAGALALYIGVFILGAEVRSALGEERNAPA